MKKRVKDPLIGAFERDAIIRMPASMKNILKKIAEDKPVHVCPPQIVHWKTERVYVDRDNTSVHFRWSMVASIALVLGLLWH